DQLRERDETVRNLQSETNISKMLNLGGNDDSTASSVNVQALETELCQLKDTITSLRIENDALKVTNANVHRCYKELTLSNTYLRNSSVETIKAQKVEITSLKAMRVGKPSSGTTKPANPNVIAPGMYAVSPKYIVPHRRDNRETPIPVPKKKHVTFREPQSTTRITSKPDTAIKQPNVSVPLFIRVKPASGASKPGPKSNAWIYRRLSARSGRGEKVAAHLRTLNKQNHNLPKAQKAEITSLKAKHVGKPSSGTTKPVNPNVIAPGMYAVSPKYIVPHRRDNRETPIPVPKKKHAKSSVSTTKTVRKPNVVTPKKPMWNPTGRHFMLYASSPLTRILEPIDEPIELTPSVSSNVNLTIKSSPSSLAVIQQLRFI
nr:hypothetical protein [Tanacetum cinerariifolium]